MNFPQKRILCLIVFLSLNFFSMTMLLRAKFSNKKYLNKPLFKIYINSLFIDKNLFLENIKIHFFFFINNN